MNPYVEVVLLTAFFTFFFFYLDVHSMSSVQTTILRHLIALSAALLLSQGIRWVARK
jgi:hypothetical protein